jgi:S1-C subfamily serine protease
MTKDEQKRRVWLGVEFTGVTKEMAKQLNLRRQTQDGRIGLMVNRIYPNSPASRMGLVEGDVLLTLKAPKAPWPIELKIEREHEFEGPDWEEFDVPDEFEAMGFRVPRKRPWPSRDNFFTKMLYKIGRGMAAQLTYVHNGEELQKQFIIEQAPCDALSAKKYKDQELGFTVKDLTYEVRTALKLSEDEKAIVVSKVEPGTPTALARINAFELIRAVDGQAITSVDEFESAIEQAKKEHKKSVRITVEWMGKTRLADLKFEAKDMGLKDMMKFIPGLPGGSDEEITGD